jgi:hypothetical protein
MKMHPIDPPEPASPIAHAATLLEAVARDSEYAVDFDVPLRCGQAANQLHAFLGSAPTQLPSVDDDVENIRTAITDAITLLCSLPDDELSDPVIDALCHARAAAASIPLRSVP